MKISIVTPSYNQGDFIEETINSVIQQDYENFEYIIIDGGSTDKTIAIIKKYEEHITYWISESDEGQADAINKGFKIASGEILAWINSDDTYLPGTFSKIVNIAKKIDPPYFITGYSRFINESEIVWSPNVSERKDISLLNYQYIDLLKCWENSLSQPSTFWPRETMEKIGPLDKDLYFAMDLDLWLKGISKKVPFYFVPDIFSNFRYHNDSKSVSSENRLLEDLRSLGERFLNASDFLAYKKSLKKYKNGLMVLKTERNKVLKSLPSVLKAIISDPKLILSYPRLVMSLLIRSLIRK